MTRDPGWTTIASVEEREPRGRTWWLITTADGTKHSTKNCFLASKAARAQEKGLKVLIGSSSGWHYKDCYAIRLEGEEAYVG